MITEYFVIFLHWCTIKRDEIWNMCLKYKRFLNFHIICSYRATKAKKSDRKSDKTEKQLCFVLQTLIIWQEQVKAWIQSNFFKLNSSYSEVIITGPKSLTKSTSDISLEIDNTTVLPSSQIRNLEVILNPTL